MLLWLSTISISLLVLIKGMLAVWSDGKNPNFSCVTRYWFAGSVVVGFDYSIGLAFELVRCVAVAIVARPTIPSTNP